MLKTFVLWPVGVTALWIGLHFLLLAKVCRRRCENAFWLHASVPAKSSQEKIFICATHNAVTKLVNESENITAASIGN